MGKAWHQIIISNHMSPTNKWTNRSYEPYTVHNVKSCSKKNMKMWEDYLPHVEFTYNRAVHSTTQMYVPLKLLMALNHILP
jgi:hypothetical protein